MFTLDRDATYLPSIAHLAMGRPRKQQGGTIVTCVALPEATRKQIDLRADEQGKTLSDVVRPVLEEYFTPVPITKAMAKLETQSVEELSLSSATIGQKLAEAEAKSKQQHALAKAELDKAKAEAEAKAAQVLSDAKAELDKAKAEAEAKLATANAKRAAQQETIASLWANSRECILLKALQDAGVCTTDAEPKLLKLYRSRDEKFARGATLAAKYMLQQGIVGYTTQYGTHLFSDAALVVWQVLSKRRYASNLHGALSEIANLPAIEVSEDWQDCLAAMLTDKTQQLIAPEQIWAEAGWSKPDKMGDNMLQLEDGEYMPERFLCEAIRDTCVEFGTQGLEGIAYERIIRL